jgi:dTDP-4-dehydrorhamnose reductase
MSTDCVFAGSRGSYTEEDLPDASDLYGRTKLLGEVSDSSAAITLRTSIIGRELGTRHGLLEWFLAQAGGRVRGYSEAVFSGLTTNAISELIGSLIGEHADLRGVWHVSTDPVSKYELLSWLNEAFDTATVIDRDPSVRYDRSLDSTRFWAATGLRKPAWDRMIEQLRSDTTSYEPVSVRASAEKSDA